MSSHSGENLTALLARAQAGDLDAEGQLVTILARDLRAIAERLMGRERPDHTWQPTLLVDEALFRLLQDGTIADASDRAFLLKAAGRAMRNLLVDHHRHRSAEKRGGQCRKLPLDDALDHLTRVEDLPLLDLQDEIDRLAELDARAARVVEFRFFLGMSTADVANSLGVSRKTIERDWNFARAWLRDRLKPSENS